LLHSRDENRELREELREKNRKLKNLRKQLEEKNREIEMLRSHLPPTRNAASLMESPGQDAPVFFLVGQAKSGTSWLMRTLNAHPEVLCKGEGRFFGRTYKREDIKNLQSKTLQPSSLYRAILDAEYVNAWIERSVWSRDDDKDEHVANLTRVAASYFLYEYLSKTGKRIVGDKTPFLGEEVVSEIGTIYPGARIIHIIRDGRDVAVSTMHHLWNHSLDLGGQRDLTPEERSRRDAYREDPRRFLEAGGSLFTEERIRDLATNWRARVRRAMKDGARLFGENYAEVRYENLLQSPEQEVGRLLEFLGADAGQKTVEWCIESARFERWSKGRERGQEDSTTLLRKGVVGDWKVVFNEQDREIFKEAAGDMLIKLGYEKSTCW
jgi:hypothetical protein